MHSSHHSSTQTGFCIAIMTAFLLMPDSMTWRESAIFSLFSMVTGVLIAIYVKLHPADEDNALAVISRRFAAGWSIGLLLVGAITNDTLLTLLTLPWFCVVCLHAIHKMYLKVALAFRLRRQAMVGIL